MAGDVEPEPDEVAGAPDLECQWNGWRLLQDGPCVRTGSVGEGSGPPEIVSVSDVMQLE